MAVGALLMAGLNTQMQKMMKPPTMDYGTMGTVPAGFEEEYGGVPVTDLGGRMLYDTGSRMGGLGGRHFPIMVEPGETVVSKTMNMLNDNYGQGITLNIYGDVYDSDNFAEKISEVLPHALRKSNDIGGI